MPMILSTQCNYITQNKKKFIIYEFRLLYYGNKKIELVGDGSSS